MFNHTTGTLDNSAGVKRLRIGITAADGTRAELNFVAAHTTAPLVAIISGIETDSSDDAPPDLPTERELDELYLLCAGWETITIDGLGVLWQDPIDGGAYCFADALQSQDRREELRHKSNVIR